MYEPHEYLKDLGAARQADNPRSWQVFGLMSAINGALLASLSFAQTPNGSDGPYPDWRLIVPLFALPLCLIWHGMQRRLVSWSRWQQDALAGDDVHGNVVSKILSRKKHTKHPGLSTKNCICVIPLLFAAVWEVVACLAINANKTKPSCPISIGIVAVAVVCILIGLVLVWNKFFARLRARAAKDQEKAARDEAEKKAAEARKNAESAVEGWELDTLEKNKKYKIPHCIAERAFKCRKSLRKKLEGSCLCYVMDVVPIVLGVILIVVLCLRS